MESSHLIAWCCAAMVALGISRLAAAQSVEAMVSGSGSASISRQPNLLRMQIELRGEGKDIKEALAKLHASEASARKKVLALGANEQSTSLGEVRDGSVKSPRQ